MRSFVYTGLPARVVFGRGALATVGAEVERLGARRALVLSTPGQRALAEDVAARLGGRAVGIFAEAVMHVPLETARAARTRAAAVSADCCVAIGGGTAIGLGKAIALGAESVGDAGGDRPAPSTPPIPILAIPTTFAGSEMTPIYGLTARGQKQTGRDPRVLPRTVLYDPLLLLALPARVAGPSGLNAVAHCVEALYAEDANPITSLMAEEGIRALATALPRVVGAPRDEDARGEALYGAWLGGTCLGAVGMAIHHKLCHTLGGRYNLPHAQTHASLLPHAVAYNRAAAPEAMARIARALGGGDPAQALFDLGGAVGAPMALKDVASQGGQTPVMMADDLDEATRLAMNSPYYNPRPIEYPGLRQLLQDAWDGRRPDQA